MKDGKMSLSKEEVCTNVDSQQFISIDYKNCINQSIKEGEKVVGKILYIQPSILLIWSYNYFIDTSIGLALCDAYQPPQTQWKTETSSITVIQ